MKSMVRVDPIRCDGYGMCAELLPERITLDDWGYPMIDGKPLTGGLLPLARKAVSACPTAALRVDEEPPGV